MHHLDEEQAVFEKLPLSDFKKWSTTALKVHSQVETILATESLLKMMKNAFYFTLKAFFILKILKFLS